MLLQTTPYAASIAGSELCPRRRHKAPLRRARRDLRLLAPLLALTAESLLLGSTIAIVEKMPVAALEAIDVYGPTTSISSTSNVSAAPPGIRPGDPLSP